MPNPVEQTREKNPWEVATCRVPMWGSGMPAGLCGEPANGHQYPEAYYWHLYCRSDLPYCFGHCCPMHGGPKAGEPIIFKDGNTDEGRAMYCAVMPGFTNLQECPAGFSDNPVLAVAELRKAIARERT